ncbi:MAG: NAD+ synthase [Nitrososphaerota archaeon]
MGTILPALDFNEAIKIITGFISDALEFSGCDGFILGLSGGIDSATVASLCVRAVGPSRVLGLIMPTSTTPREDVKDAEEFARVLGIKTFTIDISDIQSGVSKLYRDNPKLSRLAYGNIAPRLRMTILYMYANNRNLLVVGSGNKSELVVGYFTKYGDGGADILPIGDLYKTYVKELARILGVPQRIIDKKPSAGLWPGQTDEDELGITYNELDQILYAIVDLGLSVEETSDLTGIDIKKIERVFGMIKRSEHKRMPPPSPSIKHLLTK